MRLCEKYNWEYIFTFKKGRTPKAYADAQDLMEQAPSNSGTLVRHDARGKRVECGTVSWATGVEITRGSDEWHVFNVVRVAEDDSNGSPYDGQFATSLEVRDLKEADAVGMWGRRRWGIESMPVPSARPTSGVPPPLHCIWGANAALSLSYSQEA